MRSERALYFTPAEYALLLEMAGEGAYSGLQRGAGPDEEDLLEAFTSLFQRGLLEREGERFTLGAQGGAFVRMRQAEEATAVRASWGYDAMCYLAGEDIWAAELSDDGVSPWYRVWRMGREDLAPWLLDSRILPRPLLTDEDAEDAARLLQEELREPSGELLAGFRRCRNGGALLESYELRRSPGGEWLLFGGDGDRGEIYTVEALERLLAACFGKDGP